MLWALLPAAGFLVGSVPFSFIIAASKGIDLRKTGSGNVGATNLARLCGRRAGLAGLVLDVLKGAIPVGAALLLAAPAGLRAATAIAAIAGHVFSPWLRFRGGKGVATTLGALAVLVPLPAAGALLLFLLVFSFSRVVSVSSVAAALVLTPLEWVLGAPGDRPLLTCICGAVTLLLVTRHLGNIARLFRGTEGRLHVGSGGRP